MRFAAALLSLSAWACAPGGTEGQACPGGSGFAADGRLTIVAAPGPPSAVADGLLQTLRLSAVASAKTGLFAAPALQVLPTAGPPAGETLAPLPARAVQAAGERSVAALRHEVLEAGCERVIVELQGHDDAAPPAAGEMRAEVIRELGLVRVSLLDVRHVEPGATDAAFDGALAAAAHVVRAPGGPHVFVDVLLRSPAEARVQARGAHHAVVIELRPGGGSIPAPPARSTRVVVLAPRPGEAAYPLTVLGYARTFEANVVIRVEQDGASLVETFTTATGYVDAWGHYRATIDDGPRGAVTLHVGEYSARDGRWEGAAVDLAIP